MAIICTFKFCCNFGNIIVHHAARMIHNSVHQSGRKWHRLNMKSSVSTIIAILASIFSHSTKKLIELWKFTAENLGFFCTYLYGFYQSWSCIWKFVHYRMPPTPFTIFRRWKIPCTMSHRSPGKLPFEVVVLHYETESVTPITK